MSQPVRLVALVLALGLHACGAEPVGSDPQADESGDARVPFDGHLRALAKADGVCDPARHPGYFPYLDDICGLKRAPGHYDPELQCPNVASTASPSLAGSEEKVLYRTSEAWLASGIEVDDEALRGLVPDALHVTVILVRRVDGEITTRYLSNGTHDRAFQPWSSTKGFAAANAAVRLRVASDYALGLDAQVLGIPLGDLVTAVHDYSGDPFSSNALGRYFHDIGGRAAANALVRDWLGRGGAESFGGNYGELAPPLGYRISDVTGEKEISLAPDTSRGPSNHLSTFTMAEWLRRVVHHREDAATRMPGLQWADARALLYGDVAEPNPERPGGMSADPAVYLHQAIDLPAMEARSQGTWRIFGKLGFGKGQFVHNGYACLPALDDAGVPLPDVGKEFVISARLAEGGRTWIERDELFASAYRTILAKVLDGTLK